MELDKTLTEMGAVKTGFYGYPYKLETNTGTLGIALRGSHLFCNFIGSEQKAKVKFGHWKNNIPVKSKQEIKNHIKRLKK